MRTRYISIVCIVCSVGYGNLTGLLFSMAGNPPCLALHARGYDAAGELFAGTREMNPGQGKSKSMGPKAHTVWGVKD